VEVRQRAVPLKSEISNAYISFAQMTASAVAVISNVIRGGRPVVGFGFNSNGRYAQPGLLSERFIPRLLEAPAAELLDAKPVPGQPDMVMGECGHPMTGEDWCDGWRVCKRCPQASLFEFPEPTVPKGTPPGRWP